MKVFVLGSPRGRRGEDDRRRLQVGDEVALEPAQKTLLLVAGQRHVLPALFAAVDGGLRRECFGRREAVEVRGARDEGVRRQREQQQTRRRARPPDFQTPTAQPVAQTL